MCLLRTLPSSKIYRREPGQRQSPEGRHVSEESPMATRTVCPRQRGKPSVMTYPVNMFIVIIKVIATFVILLTF